LTRRSPKVSEVSPVYLAGSRPVISATPSKRCLGQDNAGWEKRIRHFRQGDFGEREQVYVWMDDVHCNFAWMMIGLCTLLMIGAPRWAEGVTRSRR
jgi:hypothetical protein